MVDKQQLLNRLKTIEGHVRGIQRMVEDDAYCVDILKQTKAIQRALDKFSAIVLERHLAGCVTTAITSTLGCASRPRSVGSAYSGEPKNTTRIGMCRG